MAADCVLLPEHLLEDSPSWPTTVGREVDNSHPPEAQVCIRKVQRVSEILYETRQKWFGRKSNINKDFFDKGRIFIIGGLNSGQTIESYTPSEPENNRIFHKIPNAAAFESRFLQSSAMLNENQLFLTGGQEDNRKQTPLNSSEMFYLSTQQWMASTKMRVARYAAPSAAFHNKFFVFGGAQVQQSLSCEVFDPSDSCWTPISPLPEFSAAACAVAIEDCIYILGGGSKWDVFAKRWSRTNSVKAYSPFFDNWCVAATMSRAAGALAAAHWERCIVVSGGSGDDKMLSSACERLDPREGEWQALADMKHKREGHALVNWKGTLLAIGGGDGLKGMKHVECYDHRADKWLSAAPLLTQRLYSAVVPFE